MEDLIDYVWDLLNYKINFDAVFGDDSEVNISLWQIFCASTLIYLLICFAKYLSGGSNEK